MRQRTGLAHGLGLVQRIVDHFWCYSTGWVMVRGRGKMGKEPRVCPGRVGIRRDNHNLTLSTRPKRRFDSQIVGYFAYFYGICVVFSWMALATHDGSPGFGFLGGQDSEKVVGKDDYCSHNLEAPDGFGGSRGYWAFVYLGLWCCMAGFGV